MPIAEVEMVTSVLGSSSAQFIERKHNLASLTPKDGFVSAKPVERMAWQIGETQKATREFGARIGRIQRGAGCGPAPASRIVQWCAIAVGRVSPSERRIGRLARACLGLAVLPEFRQLLGLEAEQAGFHGGGAAQPPQQAGEPQHQLPLDSRFGIVVGNDGGLERLVVFGILITVSAVRPWRTALRRDCWLPSSLLGPVLLSALRRLAWICRNEVIAARPPEMGSFCQSRPAGPRLREGVSL